MRIADLLGILFFVSTGRAQIDNLLGLNLESIFKNVKNVEDAFGQSLTEKLTEAFNEMSEGKFTPTRALKFLEDLTSEEKDGAVNGLIELVKEVKRIVSTPGVKDQIRMGLDLAPFILRQLINLPSQPPPASKTKPTSQVEDELEGETEPKKVDEVVVKLKQNDTKIKENESGGDLDSGEIRGLLGNLMGSGKVPDELLETLEQLLDVADQYEDTDSLEERLALDDKAAAKLDQIKDKLGNVKELLKEGEKGSIKATGTSQEGGNDEEKYVKGKNAKDYEKDEL